MSKNINSKTNASKRTNNSCTSKSKLFHLKTKLTKYNQTNYIFFVLSKQSDYKCIQQYNEFNKVIKQNGHYVYKF